VAFDLDRTDWRLFRIDRIRQLVPGAPAGPPRAGPGDDLATWLATDFGRVPRSTSS
jgi:predicted DNA-binding transcriptional regulator YafY